MTRGETDTHFCPHCNGYGSSLKEKAERCTQCDGTGIAIGHTGLDLTNCPICKHQRPALSSK